MYKYCLDVPEGVSNVKEGRMTVPFMRKTYIPKVLLIFVSNHKLSMINLAQISIFNINRVFKKISNHKPARIVKVDTVPKFPGGKIGLRRYLEQAIINPKADYPVKSIGRVYLRFIVDPRGNPSQIEIVKGLNFACNFEAFSLIKNMPRWKPASSNGHPVAYKKSVTINF